MSKAGRSKRKRAKARKERIAARRGRQQGRRPKILAALRAMWHGARSVWGVVVVVILLLAAGAQIYFSTWRMSVVPGETLNNSNPLTTMFVLTNEGQFAINDIEFSCLVNDIQYPNDIKVSESFARVDSFNVSRLEANTRTSTPCYLPIRVMGVRPLSVDIAVLVSYRPSFYPFHRSARYRFIARPNDRGGFSWLPMAN